MTSRGTFGLPWNELLRPANVDVFVMNVTQLRKNVGDLFRLRPTPFRIDQDGKRLPELDDHWRLEGVLRNPARVRLTNIRTDHALELESDNIQERRSPDFFLLRCQLTLTPKHVDVEPIHRGAPIVPTATQRREAPATVATKYVNMPAGYERRLNYHRYRIVKDAAARDERGGYSFPVRVKGPELRVRTFHKEALKQLGSFEAQTEFTDEMGQLAFTYSGPHGPEMIEDLATKHGLSVLECGNRFTL